MKLSVVIGDDDAGMRLVLRKAIEKKEEFEIIGEGVNGLEVLSLAERLKPDIVFVDVEMPELNGIECAKRIIDINPKMIIIFATAHAEYMEEAFSLYAFDYLVKPFKLDRVYQTLERIWKLSNEKYEEQIQKPTRIIDNVDKIMVKNKDGISFVNTNDIIIIQREDRNTVIYATDESYTTSEGLSELEARLDKHKFMRTHKSYLINLSMISKIYPYGRWTYIVKLKNTDKDALITHEKYDELKKLFEG